MTVSSADFEIPDELIGEEPELEAILQGKPGGQQTIGMLIKRTYVVETDGHCTLASDDEQEVLSLAEYAYEEVDPPLVSAIQYGDDTMAFKEATDVVVQGSAQTYGSWKSRTTVQLQVAGVTREIVVFGDRTGEWTSLGPRFSEPEPFETMPIRYERAYGGLDRTAFERFGIPGLDELRAARPEWKLECKTPFHYRRNPAGRGFLIELDRESFDGLAIPNLEYPFDPLRPESLAVGPPLFWMNGPVPAGMDWQGGRWFPRVGYLGLTPPFEAGDGQPAEVQYGWAAPDILDIPSLLKTVGHPIRSEFTQAASPGLDLPDLGPGEAVELTNMHPAMNVWRVYLPSEVPTVKLALGGKRMDTLDTHLNSVVVRPDADEIVMVWCARTATTRTYSPVEIENMGQEIAWRTRKRR